VRYQYLELAYFLLHGVCPDSTMLDEHSYSSWKDFYNQTSAILDHSSYRVSSTEVCLCARAEGWPVVPGTVSEDRHFLYLDAEVSCLSLLYRVLLLYNTVQCIRRYQDNAMISVLCVVACLDPRARKTHFGDHAHIVPHVGSFIR
jgi:hypothetical protein